MEFVRGRRVLGPVRSYATHLGEWAAGSLADAVHGLLFRTGLLARVPKWRAVAEPRAELPLPQLDADDATLVDALLRSRIAVQAPAADPPGWARGPGVAAVKGPALWTEEPRTGLTMAYSLEPEQLEALRGLGPGDPVTGLPVALRATLAGLGALGSQGTDEESGLGAMASTLAEEGFVVIPELVSAGLLRSLTEHYRAMPSRVRLESDAYCGRLVEKNESVSRHLHESFAGFVGKLAHDEVRPSYSYTMWYVPGARLRVHRDNPLCEYTLNLIVDQGPPSSTHWPLCIVSRTGRIEEVYVHPGDAVLFRGRELPHFRRRLQGDGHAIGALFHYVASSFEGDMEAAGAYD